MNRKMKETPSYSSPKGGSRGCLCKDGKTYSKKCCNGSLRGQGVGSVTLTNADSAGTINAQDTTNTVSSTSTDVPSLGSSTITVIDTTNTTVNASSTSVIGMAVTPGTYQTGDSLPLVATFNEEVTVETEGGTPTIDVNIDENTREFTYTEGSGTEDITFEYTLVEEDAGFENVEVASDIELNGGSIIDAGGDPVETSTESIVVTTENVTPPPSAGNAVSYDLMSYLREDLGYTLFPLITVFGDNEPNELFQTNYGFNDDTYMGFYNLDSSNLITQEIAREVVKWFTNEENPAINTEYNLDVTFNVAYTESRAAQLEGVEYGDSIDPQSDVNSTTGITVKYFQSPNDTYSIVIQDPNNNLSPTTQFTVQVSNSATVTEI